ncbi:MAG: endo alpha-1,4 polygalactosaminidase [Acidimicrobiia bacterium]
MRYGQIVRIAACAAAVLALGLSRTADAAMPAVHPRLASVTSFALALGDEAQHVRRLDQLAEFDLVVLDGEHASRSLIDGLHAQGALVLGYLSVGTVERGRAWTRDAKPYRLDHWDDWDEWFAETSDPAFRTLLRETVAPAILDRGFDGLFLDNVDMVANHPRQRAGMEQLVRELSALTHARGGVLFAQNGEEVMDSLLGALDGWNREDVTGTYDFDTGRYVEQGRQDVRAAQRALRSIAGRGLLVTATDYFARGDEVEAQRATRNACAAGALSYVSDIGLNRVPSHPTRCQDL